MTAKSKIIIRDLSCIILVAVALRILPIISGSQSSSDIRLYREQAVPILNNQNIYQVTHRVFPYSPVTMFIPAVCLLLSDKLNMPFYIIMKIPALIGDLFLSVAIYYWVLRLKKERNMAFKGAIAYAINPLVILISAFQGNMMSIPTLFMFLAVMIILYDRDKNYRLSALLLGLAVAFRGFPILLLPLILLKSELPVLKKIKYSAYTIIPVVLAFIPFLLLGYKSVFREVFGYYGDNEYGFAAIEKMFSIYCYIVAHNFVTIKNSVQAHLYSVVNLYKQVPCNGVIIRLMDHSKSIFLLAYLAVISRYRKLGLLQLTLSTYLGFYFFYDGAASQYFIWIIPFFYFLDSKFPDYYIIFGTYAVISVYLCLHPFTLFGRFPMYPYPAIKNIFLNEFVALSLFWSLCGLWFFNLLFKKKNIEA